MPRNVEPANPLSPHGSIERNLVRLPRWGNGIDRLTDAYLAHRVGKLEVSKCTGSGDRSQSGRVVGALSLTTGLYGT